MIGVLAQLRFANLTPLWAAVALLAAATVVLAYTTTSRTGNGTLNRLLLGLRLAAVAVLLWAIFKPTWTQHSRSAQRPVLAVVVDNSRSMSLADPASPDRTRYEQARRWWTESAGRRLADRFEIAGFDIEGRAWSSRDWPREPVATRTDLVLALRGAANHLRGRRPAAVLLISDGQDNVGRESVLSLGDLPCAVHALGFAAPPATPHETDLALEHVDAPARARLHNTTPITVTIRRQGVGDDLATVNLERQGQVLATAQVAFSGNQTQHRVQLDLTPAEAGDLVLAARVTSSRRETSLRNNTALFRMRVDAEPIRVLYLEGVLRNEYTFLVERLGQDPDVDLATFVRAAVAADEGVAAIVEELVTPQRLGQIDVVLLGDVEPGMLSDSACAHLRAWVEAGGGLMVLGGYRNLDSEGLHASALGEVLPVLPASSPGQVEQPFQFTPTTPGLSHPALTLTGQPREDLAMWESAPMLRGIVATGPARPAATVLARHPVADPADAQGQGHVVLAVQPYGQGVAALLTADTTWRWSRMARLAGQPDTLYARFWSQWIRFLAGRDTRSPASTLSLSTDQLLYRPGQTVRVNLHADPAGFSLTNQPPELSARTPDGRTIPLQPHPSPSLAHTWTAQLQPDRSGRYEIHAALSSQPAQGPDSQPQRLTTAITEFQVEGDDLELDRPWPDPSRLRQIAQLTGGSYHDLDHPQALDRILESVDDQPVTVTRTSQTPLWHSPGLFALFVGTLGVEWWLRRRHQMA